MTAEETQALAYLRQRRFAAMSDVSRSCLSGCSPEWVSRVISRLDWFGYVAVFHGPGGPAALQITDKGLVYSGG